MREEFNPADAVQAFVRRASTSATPEPASGKKEKLAVNWDSVNQTVFDAANEKKVVNMSSNEIMMAVLNKGVKAGERIVVEGGNKAVPGQPVRIRQASVQDVELPDQPVGTGPGKAE